VLENYPERYERCRKAESVHTCIASSRLVRDGGRAMERSITTAAAKKAAEIGRVINHWVAERNHHRAGLKLGADSRKS
jgi:hypothetical protein